MAIKKESPIYYWGENRYRIKTFKHVVFCHDCDLSREQCKALLMPCKEVSITHSVLRLIK